MAKSSVANFFPQVGGYWYDYTVIGLGNNDKALGMVMLGKVMESQHVGWYLKLDPRWYRGNRYALVFQGMYHAIGFDSFFGSYSSDKDWYETD